MSFNLPKAVRHKRGTNANTSPRKWTDPSAERPYGSSSARIFPRVDVFTPAGRFKQQDPANRVGVHNTSPPKAYMLPRSRSPRKGDHRLAQWKKWRVDVIPKLIPLYLTLLRQSGNLHDIDRTPPECGCRPRVRKRTITLISLQGISKHDVCSCRTTQLLLQMGYLASAPTRPTYAFDLQMLDFVRLLHLRTPPNKSAWSSALEDYLQARGFTLDGQDVIRRKLTSSLQWFTYLRIETGALVDRIVSSLGHGREPEGAAEGDEDVWEDEDFLVYLAECCPLCFGNLVHNPNLLADVIVCLDACFTQKRRNPVRGKGNDPPLRHSRTVFITTQELEAAEALVNAARPSRTGAPNAQANPSVDVVETGMKVPRSVLDGCLDSFTAADDKRTKASTKYFADTGLMAMICRHDRVLWLANMTTAGERQYYAIALIIRLFKYLPPSITVGILYDIGCQLERSCRKWALVPALIPRITWAVSVFHAYGHQWPCQLVYHPRKREGFGLSDGEGCERFWSAIEFLIPTLRVSGYHQRLFTLDVQTKFLREQSLMHLGDWLSRKHAQCLDKRSAAIGIIGELPFDDASFQHEWTSQVAYQTRPLARATDALARNKLKTIISLMDLSSSLTKELRQVNRKVSSYKTPQELQDITETRDALLTQKEEVDADIVNKRAQLGVSGERNLRSLLDSRYLEVRMKALAIKERWRAKLQGRRFEFERVDREHQKAPTASDSRLHTHISGQLARHQPNIAALARKFNDLRDELEGLIRQGRAPHGATSPRQIEQDEHYSLDVDSPIWDDTGLDDRDPGPVPLWMGNDDMRHGIQAWLMVRRCDEERLRLKAECSQLRKWAVQKMENLDNAINASGDLDIKFQLELRKVQLTASIIKWRKCIRGVWNEEWGLDWGVQVDVGPAAGAMLENAVDDSDSEEEVSDSDVSVLEAEDRVLQVLESMVLNDEIENYNIALQDEEEGDTLQSDLEEWGSPRKRRRGDVDII